MLDRGADHIGDVLMQRAIARDVQHLRAATDPEHRNPTRAGTRAERDLEGVDGAVGGTELCVRLGSIAGGIDVRPSRQQQAGQMVEQRIDVRTVERRERHHQD